MAMVVRTCKHGDYIREKEEKWFGQKDSSFTVHKWNEHPNSSYEIYKIVNGISPEIMESVFKLKERDEIPK